MEAVVAAVSVEVAATSVAVVAESAVAEEVSSVAEEEAPLPCPALKLPLKLPWCGPLSRRRT